MKKLILTILSALTFIIPTLAFAQVQLDDRFKPDNAPHVIITNGNEASYGNYFLQLIAGSLIFLAAPVAIAIIAGAGLMAVVSAGKPELLDKAKNTLKWAVIGLLVIIFSWLIISTVISLVFDTSEQANIAPTTTEENV